MMFILTGPFCSPNAGILAVQNMSGSLQQWRISGTGVVIELEADFRIMKKLKLVGYPFKIHRNTAFITGMFNSPLEVAKFEGATIKSVSGIRGTVKKPTREGADSAFADLELSCSSNYLCRIGWYTFAFGFTTQKVIHKHELNNERIFYMFLNAPCKFLPCNIQDHVTQQDKK